MDVGPSQSDGRFLPVAIESLDFRALPADLYIHHRGGKAPVLYRAAGVPFSSEDAERLVEQGIASLYVARHEHGAFRRAMVERMDRVFHDGGAPIAEKAAVIRAASREIIASALASPGCPAAVESVAEVSRAYAGWAMEDRSSFEYLMDMSSHDFGTAAHMVNVAVGCGLLLQELEPDVRAMLPVVVQGGMLHDLGKRKIPPELLNKEGTLDASEWKILREHPRLGHQELSKNPQVPQTVLEMTRDHHERIDGRGYPSGRRGAQIGLAARICAVVDVFDAITASRPYRAATPAADALAIMAEGAGTRFDERVFAAWERLVVRMLKADPARSLPAADEPTRRALDAFVPSGLLEGLGAGSGSGARPVDDHEYLSRANRRGHKRFPCVMDVRAMFIRQGKPCGVEVEQWFDARVVDLSRRGLRIETPWPLTIGDVLAIEFPQNGAAGGLTVGASRQARVVRAGRRGGEGWRSGLAFIAAVEQARAA